MTLGARSFIAALLAAGLLSCRQSDRSRGAAPELRSASEPESVGLLFLPRAQVPLREQQAVRRAVYRLAQERFRGSPDTVDGHVYDFGESETSEAKRYLLVLPYGDREISVLNDTAALYVLAVSDSAWSVSKKYSIVVAAPGELRVVRIAGLEKGQVPQVFGCVVSSEREPSVFALSYGDSVLKPTASTSFGARDCPVTDALP